MMKPKTAELDFLEWWIARVKHTSYQLVYELVEDGSTVPSSSDDDRKQKDDWVELDPSMFSILNQEERTRISRRSVIRGTQEEVHCNMMQFIDDDVGERDEYLNRSK